MNPRVDRRGAHRAFLHILCPRQPGVALVMVLWVTAALSVLVISISHVTRIETRLQAQGADRARVAALADGALRYAAAITMAAIERPVMPSQVDVRIGAHLLSVEIVTEAGLINVNHADEALLVALFENAAGLAHDDALALARNVIEWRTPGAANPSPGRTVMQLPMDGLAIPPRGSFFARPEDLRQVSGLWRDIYYRILPLVSVARVGGAGVNPMAAPAEVLTVLAGGAVEQVERIIAERDQGNADILSADAQPFEHAVDRRSTIYRLTAEYLDVSARRWRRVAWVEFPPGNVRQPVWRWLHVEPVVLVETGAMDSTSD